MIIPLRTNRPPKRRPIVTEALIILNMLVYLFGLWANYSGTLSLEELLSFGHLWRRDFHIWQLVTYQFLHDPSSIWHLAFNMLFLWIFGCAVESRLGRVSFLCFYLMGGALAGIAHMMVEPNPVIGASGAIAAVTGAFLALFPRSQIQILIFFFFIGVYSIPSLWFIGFYFALDLLQAIWSQATEGGARVAYMAHIAGYVFGFALAFTLLATRIVKREEFDVFFLFKQWRRRAAFRAASRAGPGGMWDAASSDTTGRIEKQAKKRASAPSADEQRIAERRGEINRLISDHRLPEAAAKYRQLWELDPDAVMPEARQLDLANQLQAEQDHKSAAKAYELLLEKFPTAAKAGEVRLLLGLIYTRNLPRPQRARELIEKARSTLTDAAYKALADQLLAEIPT
jgi:membrane associated rhomboid family serine protease